MKDVNLKDGPIKSFYQLDCWKEGHKLVLNIYKATKKFPSEEKYTLVSQIVRAAISITANIAEGFSRYFFKDKARFYYQARASISEVQNFLIVAKDLQYINQNEYINMFGQGNKVRQLLNGLIRATKKQT